MKLCTVMSFWYNLRQCMINYDGVNIHEYELYYKYIIHYTQ